jgi:hypothetical protein
MTVTDYKRALDAACREWETVAAERAALDKRLSDLTRTISTLTRLCGYAPTVPLGLADGCRLVLVRGQLLTASQMRDELETMGFDFSGHANALASIHVTLKRLVQSGEARFIPGGKGQAPAYATRPPIRAVVMRSLADMTRATWPLFSAPVHTHAPATRRPPVRKRSKK